MRDRRVLAWIAGVALFALLLSPVAAQAQKKGKKGPGAVNITKPVGLPVPDGTVPIDGVLNSTIEVGKRFRGKRIRDVDVTVQFTGSSGGPDPLQDLTARLIAPNGASVVLFTTGLIGNLIGPLTLTDETVVTLDDDAPPSDDATSLFSPYQGSARPEGQALWKMDNGRVGGTWTLRVLDQGVGQTGVLDSWRLNVVAGNPFKTK
jgi:subtilisin-like proprotein convertase family protein